MQILTTYPGQAPRISEAPEHIAKQLADGKELPFVLEIDYQSEHFNQEVIKLGLQSMFAHVKVDEHGEVIEPPEEEEDQSVRMRRILRGSST